MTAAKPRYGFIAKLNERLNLLYGQDHLHSFDLILELAMPEIRVASTIWNAFLSGLKDWNRKSIINAMEMSDV